MKKIFLIYLLFTVSILASCSNWRNEDLTENSSLATASDCLNNSVTTNTACLARSGKYVYSTPYNGRGLEQLDQTGPNGNLSYVLPSGWYQGRTATAFDSDLQGTNIQTGFNFFGFPGSLTGAAYPACSIDTNIANPTACTLTAGNYAYSSIYGGRGSSCNLPPPSQNVAAQCWISGSGYYLNGTSNPNCTAEGSQATVCNVLSPNYWYNTPYGGRSTLCSSVGGIPGTNGSACWTNQAGVYVLDSVCSDGYNGGACSTPSAKWVYTQLYGGRDVDCTNNNGGSCYFTGTKNSYEPNLVATNIKLGFSIFGTSGSYGGVNTNWYSGMSHDSGSQITLDNETVTYAGTNTLPANYRAIANIDKDTDGGILNGSPQITKVDRTAWPATCGLIQSSLAARISDCNKSWNGSVNGNSSQGLWSLVSRSGVGQEVWKDETTSLLWSSLVSVNLNWCKSVGNNNSSNVDVTAQNLKETDPHNICDQVFYQNQLAGVNVISACAEYTGFTTTDADISNAGKSNLNLASSPKVAWRAPTMYDYMIANANGLRFVMPDMQTNFQGDEWTSTVYSADRAQAWTFNGSTGQRKVQNRSFSNSLRCIGR